MAMYGVLHTTNVRKDRKIYSVTSTTDLENGFFGFVGDLATGETDIRTFTAKAAGSKGKVYYISTPEVNYKDESITDRALGNFYIPTGEVGDAHETNMEDILTVSSNIVTPLATNVVKGNYLVLTDGSYKLTESATIPAGAKFVAKIEGIKPSGVATFIATGSPLNKIGRVYNLIQLRVITSQEF